MRRSIAIIAAAGATALAASAPPASADTATTTTAADACIQLWTGVPGCIGLDTPCRVRDELAEDSEIIRDNVQLYCQV